jgi:hypothetical protein
MHYLFSRELLKKKILADEVGSTSGKVDFSPKNPMPLDTKEQEEH